MRALFSLHTRRQLGMSLTELLIAMVLSLGVVGTVLSVFVASKRSFLTQDNIAWMQENARHAFRKVGYDVRMSGYLGGLQAYWNLTGAGGAQALPASPANECFNATTEVTSFRWFAPMLSSNTSVPPNFGPMLYGENDDSSQFEDCLTTGTALNDYLSNTDVISLHYVESLAVADDALQLNRLYVTAVLNNGVVFKCNLTGNCRPASAPVGSSNLNFPFYSAAYYVTPCGRTGNDNVCNTADDIPALMRVRELNSTVARDRVAEGVVNMQIQYGIDNDVIPDGLPDRYINSSSDFRDRTTWGTLATVKTVRVWLLMRVREPGYSDPNGNYTFADVVVVPADGYRYQLYSNTFSVRNQYSAAPVL